ncbi:hypothetical protein Nepgr_003455 [Nepenthes gracilis]|uniref:Uncharacterized protein n=1 Tax=Nepenthes gracilis TaxID=150966 RepID=A0AAD3RZI5_NEPGR|nr:hypothetical protein Nepgr_003455 [Nepenthes gracilis]
MGLAAGSTAAKPLDTFHMTYIIYYILRTSFVLPWNTFITAVDYFDYHYADGESGLYAGFNVTVAAVGLSCLADGLVQGGLIGSAGEFPERYMQAVVAGTAASGVHVSFLRIFIKAAYSQDTDGLRRSAILYFTIGIVLVVVCLTSYNVAHRLSIIKYYSKTGL